MRHYTPPFHLSPQVLSLVADVCEAVGQLSAQENSSKSYQNEQRMACIQGNLSLEGNTLNQTQVTAILAGQHVMASPIEVQEVYHMAQAFEHLLKWQPTSEKDLCSAHQLLVMHLMDEEAGQYRKHDHATHQVPASRVPFMMLQLLDWLAHTEHHPLITSSIFHYEFQRIQPFSQGNARMARLWQNLILTQWRPIFHHLPIEAMLHQQGDAPQEALKVSLQEDDAEPLTSSLLKTILSALKTNKRPQEERCTSNTLSNNSTLQDKQEAAPQVKNPLTNTVTPQGSRNITPPVDRLLTVMQGEMTRENIQEKLGLSDRKSFRNRYLSPALQAGLIEMTIPDKPNSKAQRYKKTLR